MPLQRYVPDYSSVGAGQRPIPPSAITYYQGTNGPPLGGIGNVNPFPGLGKTGGGQGGIGSRLFTGNGILGLGIGPKLASRLGLGSLSGQSALESDVAQAQSQLQSALPTLQGVASDLSTVLSFLGNIPGAAQAFGSQITSAISQIQSTSAGMAAYGFDARFQASGETPYQYGGNLLSEVQAVISQIRATKSASANLASQVPTAGSNLTSLGTAITSILSSIANLLPRIGKMLSTIQNEYFRDMAQTLQLGAVNPQHRIYSGPDTQSAMTTTYNAYDNNGNLLGSITGHAPQQVPSDEGGPYDGYFGDTLDIAANGYTMPLYDAEGPVRRFLRERRNRNNPTGYSIIQNVSLSDFTQVFTIFWGDGTSQMSPNGSHVFSPPSGGGSYFDILPQLQISVLDSKRVGRIFSRLHGFRSLRFGRIPISMTIADTGANPNYGGSTISATDSRVVQIFDRKGNPVNGTRIAAFVHDSGSKHLSFTPQMTASITVNGTSYDGGTLFIWNSGGYLSPVTFRAVALRNPLATAKD